MGLDSYWELPEGAEAPTFEPELNLCGGMLSGHGGGSFRGKVYDSAVAHITGQTLYEYVIHNDKVKEMADKLEAAPDESFYEKGWQDFLNDEVIADLKRMFRGYADAGASLKGWW
jgi:hypothetical protein